MLIVVEITICCVGCGGRRQLGPDRARCCCCCCGRHTYDLIGPARAAHDHASTLEPLVGLTIDHEQEHLVLVCHAVVVEARPNALHNLLVILVRYVHIVDLDDAVAFAQTGRLGWRVGVHFADVLA